MAPQTFPVFGVHGTRGELLPPLTREQVASHARRSPPDGWTLARIKAWLSHLGSRGRGLAEKEDDATNLADAGWAVIFARDDPRADDIRQKLAPLLDRRRDEARRKYDIYYREISGADGYAPGESKQDFLSRLKVGPGPAQPQKLPYYLLLVGDPTMIPYEFQYQLDIEYAVGRLHFDTLEEYGRYAESVVAAEKAAAPSIPSQLSLFGPCHPGDDGTKLSSHDLVEALGDSLAAYRPNVAIGEKATKTRLAAFLGGSETPDVLFTAGHGVLFDEGHPLQATRQGSLVCQDWPGPHAGPVESRHAFSAEDVSDQARLGGLVTFHFACFSAGWPESDDFMGAPTKPRTRIASQAAVGKLPQRLLAHPMGSALAVIGHVEKSFQCSITWPGAGPEIQHFEQALSEIMAGKPVGYAMEVFGKRYAELSSDLCALLINPKEGDAYTTELARLWTASHDARNYVLLGDPAVRLRCSGGGGVTGPGGGPPPPLMPAL